MNMKDVFVSREQRFAIEQDIDSGNYYISFPVFNGLVEYSEFYKISKDELEVLMKDKAKLYEFVSKCKDRKMDDRLLMKPGRIRGEPC